MKAIIFDFGNVVGFFDHRVALEKLRPFSPLTPEEMYVGLYDGPLEDQIERGQLTPHVFMRKVHELWRLNCDIEFLTRAVADIFTPNPEVCELIPKLRGRYRILLGSNTNAIHAAQFRAQFAEVLSHFDALVLSYEIGTRKPDADFFQHCVRLAAAQPSECVFVDDLAGNIDAARAVGLHGLHYRPGENLAAKLQAVGVE
jgi:glucose-1-phosphatase